MAIVPELRSAGFAGSADLGGVWRDGCPAGRAAPLNTGLRFMLDRPTSRRRITLDGLLHRARFIILRTRFGTSGNMVSRHGYSALVGDTFRNLSDKGQAFSRMG